MRTGKAFRPEISDYVVYQKLLEITEGFTRAFMISTLDLANYLKLMPADVEAALDRLQGAGYIDGLWADQVRRRPS